MSKDIVAPSRALPQTPADVLRAAADLIEPVGAWTTGQYARNSEGRHVSPRSPRATCWCAYGAIAKIEGRVAPSFERAEPLVAELGSVIHWNDAPGRTQAEVVAKLREVAAKLDAEENETARHTNPAEVKQ